MRSKHTSKHLSSSHRDAELERQLLDDELLGLGMRLSGEAEQLAELYPPKVESALGWPDGSRQPGRQRLGRLARGSLVRSHWLWAAAVSCGIVFAWAPWFRPLPDTVTGTPAVSTHIVPPLSGTRSVAEPTQPLELPVTTVSFVSELSDPELEAWLDLRRDDAGERIAF